MFNQKRLDMEWEKMKENRNFWIYELTFWVALYSDGLLSPSTYADENYVFVVLFIIGIVFINIHVAIKLFGK
ncbi:hypothetical protein OQI89_02985 [Lentilactobacillus diolivorans]|uniref:hypothetical protein n=1 Tax=Lentilactobacillus diolivorans TaxID=179838 RepID=UPI0024687C48|nr:hypothetical protein [Lentilactobacillus diolivorans]MDH5104813.1 hypothetical protein [Lentilactobacillus diolivorans]